MGAANRKTLSLLMALASMSVIAGPMAIASNRPASEATELPPAWRALKRAIRDLTQSFPKQYRNGASYLKRLERLEAAQREMAAEADASVAGRRLEIDRVFEDLRREALLANPLLDFDRLLLIKRNEQKLGLVNNWESNEYLPLGDYDNEIDVLSPVRPSGSLTRLYRPSDGGFVGDLNLDFDAERLLFSMRAANGRFQVFEIRTDGSQLRQLPLIEEPDVDNYEGCYLPSGDIIFCSTAPFNGVPCVQGRSHISQLYRLSAQTKTIRRLCFDQDHNWGPTVLDDGTVLYQRWEYADIPHYAARILFTMNPDGTNQREYYGSNSYWPNSMFFARPIPGQPARFVAVLGGHHGIPRMGELGLFDTALGRREADGAIQLIPGFGKKVEPIIKDEQVRDIWPKYLNPVPLSDKYFLVSAQLEPHSSWGIYLVDVFDNALLLKSVPGYALVDPIPLRKTRRPPVIVDRVDRNRKDALVVLQDIYVGRGLYGVPRGAVKQLRLLTYHFAYQGMGGERNRVGMDGPWDIKRVLGTVPVESDGSAYFRIPANTPISLQPLDADGKAIQLMRSWLTGMPGETVSCVGCHEPQNTAPVRKPSLALSRPPSEIKPWHGPTRGFSFMREVQPVLDRYCIGCHHGQQARGGANLPNFCRRQDIHPEVPGAGTLMGTMFPPSYLELRRFVRGATLEGDLRGLIPYEVHADTSILIRLLQKGHHGVKLDAESWDRLITWIDLNAPAQGTWHEIVGWDLVAQQRDRRREMLKRYADIDEDPEAVIETANWKPMKAVPAAEIPAAISRRVDGPPSAAAGAVHKVKYEPAERAIPLGKGLSLRLQYIPPGEFVMGDDRGFPDERPSTRVKVERGFWMGQFEISNEQYALFDPLHDSFMERSGYLQFNDESRGARVNAPRQPVCRVSWEQAVAFCRWLGAQTGERFRLPTEAEWEYSARAGTTTPLWYGRTEDDFSQVANLADAKFKFGFNLPGINNVSLVGPYRPAMEGIDDHFTVSAPVGSFRPNPWGLHDMHGNVAEWTLTTYKPYPYDVPHGGDDYGTADLKVVRGGSWSDCPQYARSSYRRAHHPWQAVFDVGFRVVSEGPDKAELGRLRNGPSREVSRGHEQRGPALNKALSREREGI